MPAKPNRARRIVVPFALILLAVGIVTVMLARPAKQQPASQEDTAAGEAAPTTAGESAGPQSGQAPLAKDDELVPPLDVADAAPDQATAQEAASRSQTPSVAADEDGGLLSGLRAVAPRVGESGPDANLRRLGSLDIRSDLPMRIDFATAGAGIERILMNHHWRTWQARKQAEAHRAALAANDPNPPPMPGDELRFQLNHARVYMNYSKREGKNVPVSIPAIAATEILINGQSVSLFDYTYDENDEKVYVWTQSPDVPDSMDDDLTVAFVTDVRNAAGQIVVHVRREYSLGASGDIMLRQIVENRTDQPLDIQWRQYGPSDLDKDRSQYIDNRRFRFGWLDRRAPGFPNSYVFADDDHLIERRTLLGRFEDDIEDGVLTDNVLWPDERSQEREEELAWFASTSRYFAMAVHPDWTPQRPLGKSLRAEVDRVLFSVSRDTSGEQTVFTYLYSPTHTVNAGESASFDLGIYAGPMDRRVLGEAELYVSLHLDGLILYMMSTWCTICTFQWLAHILINLLTFFHAIVFDWGIAIILLVVIVRALLHPILKKSQIGMQRFSRQMQKIQPELQKLQKKYANDPKRMQQEQIRLWREHGVSPLGCLNMLPLFLQMPIWVALYAMLYFAFDLRQQPAFYGVFQNFWDWSFLADLSASDHFFYEFVNSHQFLLWNVTGINLLPLLMGVVFFVQQKYMSPPPSPTMSKEMLQQQKIMKVMMVVLFPLMLYSAPSGLTLYILTSSLIGIVESRWIRAHIKEMDLDAPRKQVVNEKQKKPRGVMGRAYARAMEAAEERRRRKAEPPPPRFKKRK